MTMVGCTDNAQEGIVTSAGELAGGAAKSPYTNVNLLVRVSQVHAYILGGKAPTLTCANGTDVRVSAPGVDSLRRALAAGAPPAAAGAHGTCTAGPGCVGLVCTATATVDGLDTGVTRVSCADLDLSDTAAMSAVSDQLDQCWYNGVVGLRASDFWNVRGIHSAAPYGMQCDDCQPSYSVQLEIDPEPAHLNGALFGNGSSASATFAQSLAATRGYRWPGSWAVGSAPAGAPCATYAASAGTILYSTIQAAGSYRKCM